MNESAPAIPEVVQVQKRYKARRDRVWAAWTEVERFTKWFGSHGWKCAGAVLDNRVGGERSMQLKDPEGNDVRVYGQYIDIDPPSMMSFTWNVDGPGRHLRDTIVTIEFRELPGGTELTVTHEKIPTDQLCQEHREGWIANLDLVGEYLEA